MWVWSPRVALFTSVHRGDMASFAVTAETAAAPAAPARPSRKGLLALLALALLGPAFIAGVRILRAPKEPLPDLGEVPAFRFTAQDGKPFGTDELKGKVWVANFIFTRCESICPPFTAKMLTLSKKSAESLSGLRMVSFSMDPEFDTPEVLTKYAQEKTADTTRWAFLTAPRDEMEKVVVKGLFQPMTKGDGSLISIGHSSQFVLVDARGHIRGFISSKEDDAVSHVLRDAEALTREARQ
jgi:protein SCO1